MTRMTRIFKAALYIPAYHTEGKKNPRHPCHPCLKDYLHAEGEPCSSATLVNYHLFFKSLYSSSSPARSRIAASTPGPLFSHTFPGPFAFWILLPFRPIIADGDKRRTLIGIEIKPVVRVMHITRLINAMHTILRYIGLGLGT